MKRTTKEAPSAALARVAAQIGVPDLAERLATELAGADLTTLLLEVMRRRAARVSPSALIERYRSDRFVAPGDVSFRRLRDVEDALLSAVPPEFELVVLSPVVPLGTHSAVATVSQNKVVSTVRMSEVAADPTNALALEAAVRH